MRVQQPWIGNVHGLRPHDSGSADSDARLTCFESERQAEEHPLLLLASIDWSGSVLQNAA